jgi:hypothetical protein
VGTETLKCKERNKIRPVKIKVKFKIHRKEDGRIKVLFYILFLHVLSYCSISLYFFISLPHFETFALPGGYTALIGC